MRRSVPPTRDTETDPSPVRRQSATGLWDTSSHVVRQLREAFRETWLTRGRIHGGTESASLRRAGACSGNRPPPRSPTSRLPRASRARPSTATSPPAPASWQRSREPNLHRLGASSQNKPCRRGTSDATPGLARGRSRLRRRCARRASGAAGRRGPTDRRCTARSLCPRHRRVSSAAGRRTRASAGANRCSAGDRTELDSDGLSELRSSLGDRPGIEVVPLWARRARDRRDAHPGTATATAG